MLCTSLIIFAPHLCFRFCLCKPNFLAAFHTAPGRSLLKSPKTWERCFFGTVIASAYLSHLAASNQSSGSLSSLVLRKKSWHTVSRRCSTFLRFAPVPLFYDLPCTSLHHFRSRSMKRPWLASTATALQLDLQTGKAKKLQNLTSLCCVSRSEAASKRSQPLASLAAWQCWFLTGGNMPAAKKARIESYADHKGLAGQEMLSAYTIMPTMYIYILYILYIIYYIIYYILYYILYIIYYILYIIYYILYTIYYILYIILLYYIILYYIILYYIIYHISYIIYHIILN